MNTIRRSLSPLLVLATIAGSIAWGVDPSTPALAQAADPRTYDVGTPTVSEIWVDGARGNDANSGASRAQALRTIYAAWQRIPRSQTLATTGYKIQIVSGTYAPESTPNYWESRWGTYQYPVILQAADGRGTVTLPSLNVYDCRYFYLIDVNSQAPGGDVVHFEACDHVLLRGVKITGARPASYAVQEALKINQSKYVYVESSDVSGAWDNAIDCVAVQYGHFVGNRIHDSGDWCLYLKGGSAYFRVESNEFYDGGTGGFTAGQGTGFEFMTPPWLHYEAYDIKFVNNVVHDTDGAGMGVNGGYNILLAYNTLYRVGNRSHVLEFVHGSHSCDGDAQRCAANLAAGGWGVRTPGDFVYIPNRNVYVYNNVVYNPAGYQSQWQQFAVANPEPTPSGSNVASPARADVNLVIKGNVIWNGPQDHPIGFGESSGGGCGSANQSCNEAQVRRDNSINTIEPQFVNAAGGDFRPVAGGSLITVPVYAIPDFAGGDRPARPATPVGVLSNAVLRDFAANVRTSIAPPGAYVAGGTAPPPPPPPPTTYAVSGRVNRRNNRTGLPNVTVQFAALDGSAAPASVRTNSSGDWSQTGFAAGKTYRVTPARNGYAFAPASRDVSGASTGVTFRVQ